ncbi:hypothetical protein GF324_00365, partial [bacterium]|nr:hypothetical protein [bacterium]
MMRVEEFEQLWLNRHELEPEEVRQLEKMCFDDPYCRSFAEQNGWIREFLLDVDQPRATSSFSYQMRVYAENHPNAKPSLTERPVLKWSGLGVGIATGAVAVALMVGPMQVTSVPTGTASEGTLPAPSDVQLADEETQSEKTLSDSSEAAPSRRSITPDRAWDMT